MVFIKLYRTLLKQHSRLLGEKMEFIKKHSYLPLFTFILAIFEFLKNAWITEDAYIIFRTLEQVIAGHGPIWNPHERVQAFTSPLWFLILLFVRVFSNNVYLNAIFVSLSLWIITLFLLWKIFKNNMLFLTAVMLLLASTGFYDYTSSGLENVLAYLLITNYLLIYYSLFSFENINNIPKEKLVILLLLLAGLILFVRYDLLFLLLPPTIYTIAKSKHYFPIRKWILWGFVALLPIGLWTLFSLIYYGFPFPNTAYAKLGTGIIRWEILKQGWLYFVSSLHYDFATLLVIVGVLVWSIFHHQKYFRYTAYGILLNLLYVGYIGGDFMLGRFFSYAYLVATISFVLMLSNHPYSNKKLNILVFIIIAFYLSLYPHTPFNSPFTYVNHSVVDGIADERGFYFNILSLHSYMHQDPKAETFPEHPWAKDGLVFKKSPNNITVREQIGVFGYFAGTEKIIIDTLGLSDPLLARMKVPGWWRIGHFRRQIPDGYLESVVNGTTAIRDTEINKLYKELRIITQDDRIFSLERLKNIIRFNLEWHLNK